MSKERNPFTTEIQPHELDKARGRLAGGAFFKGVMKFLFGRNVVVPSDHGLTTYGAMVNIDRPNQNRPPVPQVTEGNPFAVPPAVPGVLTPDSIRKHVEASRRYSREHAEIPTRPLAVQPEFRNPHQGVESPIAPQRQMHE